MDSSSSDLVKKMAARLKEGQAVWVKDAAVAKSDLYCLGHVIDVNGSKANVDVASHGKSQTVSVPIEECFHVNVGTDPPDHCQLVYLSEPTLLDNTRKRFAKDKIYTCATSQPSSHPTSIATCGVGSDGVGMPASK